MWCGLFPPPKTYHIPHTKVGVFFTLLIFLAYMVLLSIFGSGSKRTVLGIVNSILFKAGGGGGGGAEVPISVAVCSGVWLASWLVGW